MHFTLMETACCPGRAARLAMTLRPHLAADVVSVTVAFRCPTCKARRRVVVPGPFVEGE